MINIAKSLRPHIYDNTVFMTKLFDMKDTQYDNKKFLWSELVRFNDYINLVGAPLTQFAANFGILRNGDDDTALINRITFTFGSWNFFGNQEDYYRFMEFFYGFTSNQVKFREVPNTKLIITVPDTANINLIKQELTPLKAAGVNLNIASDEYVIDFTYTELKGFANGYTDIKELKYKRS